MIQLKDFYLHFKQTSKNKFDIVIYKDKFDQTDYDDICESYLNDDSPSDTLKKCLMLIFDIQDIYNNKEHKYKKSFMNKKHRITKRSIIDKLYELYELYNNNENNVCIISKGFNEPEAILLFILYLETNKKYNDKEYNDKEYICKLDNCIESIVSSNISPIMILKCLKILDSKSENNSVINILNNCTIDYEVFSTESALDFIIKLHNKNNLDATKIKELHKNKLNKKDEIYKNMNLSTLEVSIPISTSKYSLDEYITYLNEMDFDDFEKPEHRFVIKTRDINKNHRNGSTLESQLSNMEFRANNEYWLNNKCFSDVKDKITNLKKLCSPEILNDSLEILDSNHSTKDRIILLTLEFEKIIRNILKQINIQTTHITNEKTEENTLNGLISILRNNSKNYKKLVDYIDYMLNNKYNGYGIRNNIAHGFYKNKDYTVSLLKRVLFIFYIIDKIVDDLYICNN